MVKDLIRLVLLLSRQASQPKKPSEQTADTDPAIASRHGCISTPIKDSSTAQQKT